MGKMRAVRGKKFRLTVPGHGMPEEVRSLTQGPVLARLMSTDSASVVLIDELIKSMRLLSSDVSSVREALRRFVESEHKAGEGFDKTLCRVIEQLSERWTEHGIRSGIRTLIYLERHGFAYETLGEHLECLRGMTDVIIIAIEEGAQFPHTLAGAFPLLLQTRGEEFLVLAIHMFVHALSEEEGMVCLDYAPRGRRVLSIPVVPSVMMMYWRDMFEIFSPEFDRKKAIGLPTTPFDTGKLIPDGWRCFKRIGELDLNPDEQKRVIDLGAIRLVQVLRDRELSVRTMRLALLATVSNTELQKLLDNTPEYIRTVKVWEALACLCSLGEFHTLGGTQDAWETHVAKKESDRMLRAEQVRQKAEEEARLRQERQAANAPNPQKRGSRGYAPGKPAEVDFEALCSELDVCTQFPGMDGDITRIILVHGLLRDGERLASLASLPERNEKKLWGQCKTFLGGGTSRREFKGALGKLVSAHLVSFSGGSYQLGKPNPRFPQANAVLTQLRGLVNKYS
ncbi:MAG: hypothetical protein HQ488_04810 [Parcubacteria group bacterium]|nr:hypothetical protein [Parcubacteria group bacterium]